MTSRGSTVISADATDGVLETMKKLRQRMLHKEIQEKGHQ
jgi:hypothetical protein